MKLKQPLPFLLFLVINVIDLSGIKDISMETTEIPLNLPLQWVSKTTMSYYTCE